jgi:GNAT superfamily N-acetyltransferase
MEGAYSYRLFDARSGPDLVGICALVGRAWSPDYGDRSVLRFDMDYLRWLLGGRRWFGIEVRDAADLLVGCEVALERRIIWARRALCGYYATLLMVAPDHRGRGIAQGILRHLTAEALDRRRADVIVSAFDAGSAGCPTVERSVAGARGDLSLRLSPPLKVWACSADLREVDRYEPLSGAMRAALWPGVRRLLEFEPRGADGRLAASPSTLDEAAAAIACHGGFGFELSGSPTAQYAHRDGGAAGTLRLEFGGAAAVYVAWHVAPIARPGLPDRPIGTIQFAIPDRATPRNQACALRHVNRLLLRQGCLATIILDAGMISRRVLWRSGFRPTPRRIRFAVRGRTRRLSVFPRFSGPFGLDLL